MPLERTQKDPRQELEVALSSQQESARKQENHPARETQQAWGQAENPTKPLQANKRGKGGKGCVPSAVRDYARGQGQHTGSLPVCKGQF